MIKPNGLDFIDVFFFPPCLYESLDLFNKLYTALKKEDKLMCYYISMTPVSVCLHGKIAVTAVSLDGGAELCYTVLTFSF